MAIKDSIVNLKKGLRITLTNVPALIDTLVRGLDGVEEAAEEQTTYSTTERIVGKWTDGSNLYECVVNFGALPNSTGATKAHNIANIDKIYYLNGSAVKSDGAMLPIPYVESGKGIGMWANRSLIAIVTESNRSDFNGVITMRYTKGSTSRSPEENDTKNGDEEKNDEEVKNER